MIETKNYDDKCKLLSWPKKLESLSGIETINIAKGGVSNQEISHRLIVEYNNTLKSFKPQEILIICMLTNPDRIGFPQHSEYYGGKYEYQSFILTQLANIKPDSMKNIVSGVIQSYNDYDLLWNSFISVNSVIDYINYNQSKIILIDSCLWTNALRRITMDSTVKDFINHQIPVSLVFADVIRDMIDPYRLPNHHYSELAHTLFASTLYRTIKNTGIDIHG